MTISEMHTLFRTFGQQKGMQHNRAILPEEIDDYLNAAIIDFCRETLAANSSTQYADKRSLRDNAIVPYNALRTLYTEIPKVVQQRPMNGCYVMTMERGEKEILAFIGADINYESDGHRYPCRIIEPAKLAYILNDYCNKPTKFEPCCLIDSDTTINAEFHIYTDGNKPYQIFVHAINNPKVVKLEDNVDCDLPVYVHKEIVERAVRKFFESVGATTHQVKQ